MAAMPQHQQEAQKFTAKFGDRRCRQPCLRPCGNQCGMTGFGTHRTCCTYCKGPSGPHADDCRLKNAKVCANGCGWTAFGEFSTCCASCKTGIGPHASDCSSKNARVIMVVDDDQQAQRQQGREAPHWTPPTPQQRRQHQAPAEKGPGQQNQVGGPGNMPSPPPHWAPAKPDRTPQQQDAMAGAGGQTTMVITVPMGWVPGSALQVPHPSIPGATITVQLPPNATVGAQILVPIPTDPANNHTPPAPSAPPACEEAPGKRCRRDEKNDGAVGGIAGFGGAAAVGAAGAMLGGCVVAGVLIGEEVRNGDPAAMVALAGEGLQDLGRLAMVANNAGEAAAGGWADAANEFFENLH